MGTGSKAEGFPITMACQVAGVSRQGFYDWRKHQQAGPTDADRFETRVVAEMRRVHEEFDEVYGSPRMTGELRDRGYCVNHERVERLMRSHGIVGVYKAPKVRTTIPADHDPPLPDLINRRFSPGVPDVAWVGDISYIRTGQGWLYLATVIDLGSRRLVGYSMADHMRTQLVIDALGMAVTVRAGRTSGIIFHSDRGAQYLSAEYGAVVKRWDMVQSVGRTGVCWDNAVAEAFFGSLKRELVHRYQFPDRSSARRAIFAWINRYNHRRLHSTLGNKPPVQWENQYHQQQANQAA